MKLNNCLKRISKATNSIISTLDLVISFKSKLARLNDENLTVLLNKIELLMDLNDEDLKNLERFYSIGYLTVENIIQIQLKYYKKAAIELYEKYKNIDSECWIIINDSDLISVSKYIELARLKKIEWNQVYIDLFTILLDKSRNQIRSTIEKDYFEQKIALLK